MIRSRPIRVGPQIAFVKIPAVCFDFDVRARLAHFLARPEPVSIHAWVDRFRVDLFPFTIGIGWPV